MNGHTAIEIAAAIRANVDAFYADEVSYEAFSDNARTIWASVAGDGELRALVCSVLRNTAR